MTLPRKSVDCHYENAIFKAVDTNEIQNRERERRSIIMQQLPTNCNSFYESARVVQFLVHSFFTIWHNLEYIIFATMHKLCTSNPTYIQSNAEESSTKWNSMGQGSSLYCLEHCRPLIMLSIY